MRFSENQIRQIERNTNVLLVSERSIAYQPIEIFKEAGLDKLGLFFLMSTNRITVHILFESVLIYLASSGILAISILALIYIT